jgi:hypothetical protein
MRSPAHDDPQAFQHLERLHKTPITGAPFGWFGPFLIAITLVIGIGLMQDRDARIERQARAEDAARTKVIAQLMATCPRSETDARTIVAFFHVTDEDIKFDHCIPMKARSTYSPATRTLMARE